MQAEFHKTELWRRAASFGVRRGPAWFVRLAPPLIGWTMAVLLPRARRAIRRNLRLIHGPRSFFVEMRDVFATFASFARSLVDGMQTSERARTVKVHGAEGLRQLIESGRGLVLITAHAGPYDRAAQLVASELGARILLLMAREDDRRAEGVQDTIRTDWNVRVLRLGGHPLDALPALQHLGGGGIVAAQMDRLPDPGAAVTTELFGEPFVVPRGPFLLAGLAQVPVAPVFVAHLPDGDYRIFADSLLDVSRRPTDEELRVAARAALLQFEDYLREFPTQWYHFDGRADAAVGFVRERRGAGDNHLAKGAP